MKSNLKILRFTQNLTQAQIAAKIGVSQPYISMIENSHRLPSREVMARLIKALDFAGRLPDGD